MNILYSNSVKFRLSVLAAGLTVFVLSLTGIISAGQPVLADKIIIEKKARRLTLYAGTVKLKEYKIALGRGGEGRKSCKGDLLTPEGKYRIDGRNPQSAYHLSLHISYPDKEDSARAAASGCEPGGDIMIHGIKNGFGWLGSLHRLWDWTLGCVAVTNGEIEELWKLVPDGTEVEMRP